MKKYKGFIEPVIDSTHYFLGAGLVPQVVLQPNSDWADSLPETEKQQRQFETFNCTSFNTLNAIEMLMFKKFGQRVNYSDRWVGIVAGTSAQKGGNDPHVVCEAIRKNGLIPEEMLPYSNDLQSADEYYSFKGRDEDACRRAGKEWLKQYDFKHEWVFDKSQPLDEKILNMKQALKYSPLALSVYAWSVKDGVYWKAGAENHWTSKFAQPKLSKIFDSYDPFIKDVDQNFSYCKRFSIEKQATQQEIGIFLKMLQAISNWLKEWQVEDEVKPPVIAPQPQPQPIVEPLGSKLVEWAFAIRDYEGSPGDLNYRNNNPGNLRSVKGPFLKFPTWEAGWNALLDYLTRAATGKHKAYKPEFSLLQFFNVYAPTADKNNPTAYAKYVAKRLNVPTSTKIKDLV